MIIKASTDEHKRYTIRCFLSLSAFMSWLIISVDRHTVFLNMYFLLLAPAATSLL